MKPKPWSFTALQDFENCPKQFLEVKLNKRFPFIETKETQWGKQVHKHFENYLVHGASLPADLLTHKEFLDDFMAQPGELAGEERIALDRNLNSCPYFGDDLIWWRGQVDARKRDRERGFSHILDHKTGKQKADLDQLKQFAMHEFLTQPEIHTVKVEYYWTQTKAATGATFERSQMVVILRDLTSRLNRFADACLTDTFTPKQSGLCAGWCPVTDCQFWRPKRTY
jgi:hypothetical protein